MELFFDLMDATATWLLSTPFVLSLPALLFIGGVIVGGFVIAKAQEMGQ